MTTSASNATAIHLTLTGPTCCDCSQFVDRCAGVASRRAVANCCNSSLAVASSDSSEVSVSVGGGGTGTPSGGVAVVASLLGAGVGAPSLIVLVEFCGSFSIRVVAGCAGVGVGVGGPGAIGRGFSNDR